MPKKLQTAPSHVDSIAAKCPYCDPPEDIRRKLGSAIGQYRYQHYLTFTSTEGLSDHLKTFVRPFQTEKGYSFDEWLRGVLRWHEQKISRRVEDTQFGPDTRFDSD